MGIFNQAKSRAGSHISDTADGRYAPIEAAKVVPTFWDVRLIMPSNDPLCFLPFVLTESEVLLPDRVRSSWESLPPGLRLRSRWLGEMESIEDSSPLRGCGGAPSLKMCTVSVAEDTHRREEVVLNDMLYMREGMEPRRNW